MVFTRYISIYYMFPTFNCQDPRLQILFTLTISSKKIQFHNRAQNNLIPYHTIFHTIITTQTLTYSRTLAPMFSIYITNTFNIFFLIRHILGWIFGLFIGTTVLSIPYKNPQIYLFITNCLPHLKPGHMHDTQYQCIPCTKQCFY